MVGPSGRIVAIEANRSSVERLREARSRDDELASAGNIEIVSRGIAQGLAQYVLGGGPAQWPESDVLEVGLHRQRADQPPFPSAGG